MVPHITVITVAWNAAATIADTMDSIAAQTNADHEHLVIDGASTDQTLDIVRARSTPNTRIISEPDKGLYDAMNKGLANARGEYVGFLNADDFFIRRDALSLLSRAGAGKESAISGGVAIVREADPQRWLRSYSATHFKPWMFRFGHQPPHPGFYLRRDIVDDIGNFDTALKVSADFDLLLRYYLSGHRPALLPETLVAVRSGGASNSGFQSRKTISRETLASLRKNGISSSMALTWAKYAMKLSQYIIPPAHFPAPAVVRWQASDA